MEEIWRCEIAKVRKYEMSVRTKRADEGYIHQAYNPLIPPEGRMKTDLIQTLTQIFEGHAQQTENGVEYWLARDLQHLLGYTEWRNFTVAID